MKVIKDAIHGYIELNDLDIKLLDTSQMQRLRKIKQLGFANLVYPSATHSRFEHSLGTFEVTKKFCKSLGFGEEREQKLKAAALLHDIGHGPFSHTTETIIKEKTGRSHEKNTINKIKNTEIKDILVDYGYQPSEITELITGNKNMGKIIAGKIDADRIDYLQRDAYYTGVAHGTIEADTIIRSASIENNNLVFKKKGLLSLESLLVARFLMIPTVMLHHTTEIAEKMMQKAIALALEAELTIDRLQEMNDWDLFQELKESKNIQVKNILQRLNDRKLYKRALTLHATDYDKKKYVEMCDVLESNRKDILKDIIDRSGLKRSEIILNIHRPHKSDEKDTKVIFGNQIKKLGEVSPIVNQIDKSLLNHLAIDIYAPKRHRKKVNKEARSVLTKYIELKN